MTTQTNNLTKLPDMDSFVTALKDNGFTVILSKEPTTYFHFFKDGKMGYVEKGYYSGYNYSSNHKPCRSCGTGFGVLQNVMELSIENANKAINSHGWNVVHSKYKDRKLYESPEEFINSNTWAQYYIL